ncbi:MAG TPA: peptide-methionine (S)-S-oxide reductase MsrA [Holophagaceae bacterium]|nr:peptide-methionine (S)-S-oxide reductase MsrA [Holophagaceae bacterium]
MFFQKPEKLKLPEPGRALPGRSETMPLPPRHRVFGTPLDVDVPGAEVACFGLGCFWGAERLFWRLPGVLSTAAGYQGGETPNPTYEEVCSGLTGHTEVVRVLFDPAKTTYGALLKAFWEAHDPTQGMRQGNDVGTQYRSAIYTTTPAQLEEARASLADYAAGLKAAGYPEVTTEVRPAPPFYFAEPYHQQYLDANPNGYCGLKGTGVSCALPSR